MSNIVMFEDIFVVDKIDPDGKKFDRVSRIEAHSMNCDMFMHLDVNIELYPMAVNDKFTLVLAHTLNLDGTPDTGYYTQGGRKTLADKYEYVMHGKLFKISEEGLQKPFKTDWLVQGDVHFIRRASNDAEGGIELCVSVRAGSEGVSSYEEAMKYNNIREWHWQGGMCTLCTFCHRN